MGKIVLLTVVVLLILLYYVEFVRGGKIEVPVDEKVENFASRKVEDLDWNQAILNKNIDDSVKKSHKEYVANVREFSSGSNFTAVADDNTSSIFTGFLGFSRPRYVEVGEGARQIPDVDTEVLKRNKRLVFKSDYF